MPVERSTDISLSGVARLARVQRPVVSMWRSRSRNSDAPFPSPISTAGPRELFDAHVVADWIAATERGNNPDVREDASAAALLDQIDDVDERTRLALAALIALSAVSDERLTSMDADEIIDLADEIDPDDDALVTELENALKHLESLAQTAADLVDTTYAHAIALSEVDRGASTPTIDFSAGTGLSTAGTALVTEVAREVIRGIPDVETEAPIIADVAGTASGFAAACAAALPESFSPVVAVGRDARADSRRTLRQLLVNGIGLADISSAASRSADRPTLRVAALSGDGDVAEALDLITDGFAELGDTERAIAYGPARILTDEGTSAAVDRRRSELIRSGQLRAIIRLPRGLIATRPRQALAMWVLAPAPASVSLSDRWTLIADASDRDLDAVTTTSIVDDIVAALGDPATLRAHAFGIGRPIRTSALAASRASLVSVRTTLGHTPEMIDRSGGGDIPARIDTVLSTLGESAAGLANTIEPTPLAPSLRAADVGTLLTEGHLHYAAGTRLDPSELNPDAGYRVIAPDQVRQGAPDGGAFVDRLTFSHQHPNARLTEPGDIVFVTGPVTAAIVDDDGLSVVAYPARVLRIDPSDPAGLVPPLVAADIRRQTSTEWKSWMLRRIVSGQRHALEDTLATIEREQRALQARLEALHSLSDLVADGVAAGRITLTPPHDLQPKGPR